MSAADSLAPTRSTEPRVKPGAVIAGKYRVERVIAYGGMGVVIEAHHLELGQSLAIKVLTLEESRRGDATARFLREGRAAATLTSEHVVRVYDVGTLDDGSPFMVMELLSGLDLATLLEDVGLLPVADAVEYVSQAALAIAEAHENGIIHRDLKPSNLFLTLRGDGMPVVKVLDFGISKTAGAQGGFDGAVTESRTLMGSPQYMSPEQLRDSKNVDARTDIWSLGVTLHELLVGEPVFNDDTLTGICAAIAADFPTPLRILRDEVPEALEAIVARCLEKDPARRFQSARDLYAALAPLRSAPRPPLIDLGLANTTPRIPSGLSNAPTLAAVDGAAVHTALGPPLASVARAVVRAARIAGVVVALAAVAASAPATGWLARSASGAPSHPVMHPHVGAPAHTAATFTIFIESVPTGADVYDGERKIGTTPLRFSAEKERNHGRTTTFTLRYPGFRFYALTRTDSDDATRVVASLVPLPETAHSAEWVVTGTPRRASHRMRETLAPPPSDLRLQR